MTTCIYCGLEKGEGAFSDEHIWPDALGGDYLPKDIWRTQKVCQQCNSVSGLFIDGSFIRSFAGKAELSEGSLDYLAGSGQPIALPLDYLGTIQSEKVPDDSIAEFWVGPCGANILHIRPDEENKTWSTYAGGNPTARGRDAGRAYMALTTENEFWICVSLLSFRKHFKRQSVFVYNAALDASWGIKSIDRQDPKQSEDMPLIDEVFQAGRRGEHVHARLPGSADFDARFLAKLGIGIGHHLVGEIFLHSESALMLRQFMREANSQKRRAIPIHGVGYFGPSVFGGTEQHLKWPGGWVLLISTMSNKLSVAVVSPTGQSMAIVISDDRDLSERFQEEYAQGKVWITVPAAKKAVGPISLPEYLSHQTNQAPLSDLEMLASHRGDVKTLPPCG